MGVVGEAALSNPVYYVGILAYPEFKISGLDPFWAVDFEAVFWDDKKV